MEMEMTELIPKGVPKGREVAQEGRDNCDLDYAIVMAEMVSLVVTEQIHRTALPSLPITALEMVGVPTKAGIAEVHKLARLAPARQMR